jgi:hypothetical protein
VAVLVLVSRAGEVLEKARVGFKKAGAEFAGGSSSRVVEKWKWVKE